MRHVSMPYTTINPADSKNDSGKNTIRGNCYLKGVLQQSWALKTGDNAKVYGGRGEQC